MLRYMARFSMTPIRCISDNEIEIRFEQREFIVVSDTRPFRDILYFEYRIYRTNILRTQRELVRSMQIHDEHLPLNPHSPLVQHWIDQRLAARTGPIHRHSNPWFLSGHAVYYFQMQCRRSTWTIDDWTDGHHSLGRPTYVPESVEESDSSSDD